MFRTVIWFAYFWISLILLVPSHLRVKWLERHDRLSERDALVDKCVKGWAGRLLKLSGCEVEVIGEENVPRDRNVLFVSNHQGNFDIPVLIRHIKKPKGFIAKKELGKMPLVRDWMKDMDCVFMDRDNPRESIRAIREGIDVLKKGNSLVLFPEGTRSSDGKLLEFKPGGLRLATKTGVLVVPVTINGTRHIMKKDSFIIKPARVRVVVSKPIDVGVFDSDTLALSEAVKKEISRNLES